jgi:hypothetical protein
MAELTELEKLMKSVESKSVNTQKSYRTQYNKLYSLLGKSISKTSEKLLIELILQQPNRNAQQALLNISILVRRAADLSTKQLELTRDKNKTKLQQDVKVANVGLKESLPTYQELLDYLEYLYDNQMWAYYVINYLLIHFQTRNSDLIFDIVKLKRDTTDKSKNYLWIAPKKTVFIRNVYKTAKVYHQKSDIITDPKFTLAIKKIMEKNIPIIPNPELVGHYVKKSTYNQLGEALYFKIQIHHFKNDMNKIKQMSNNRGTSVDTITESYNIENL